MGWTLPTASMCQGNRGTFEFEISPSTSDRITIVGAGHRASLTASTLQVLAQTGTYVPNTRYTIVPAPAGGVASFGDLDWWCRLSPVQIGKKLHQP